jgi:hypothetical protein
MGAKGYSLRYEDLIVEPAGTLKKLCEFLGLSFEERMLNYYKSETYDEPEETIDWKKKTLTPPDITNIGRYQQKLSKQEVNVFNSIATPTLRKFNYTVEHELYS